MAVDHAIGMDIGGTTIVGAVISRDGRVVSRKQIPTDSRKGSEDGLKRMGKLVSSLLKDAKLSPDHVAGIGIGATGPIDAATGKIENPFSLPGWEGIPIVASLRQQFHMPVCLYGDCQIAALGEYWMGAGQGARNLFYMTVGTGIGGAFLVQGTLYRGLSDNNEVGYQIIDVDGPECADGSRGCLEAYASGPAIARMATEAPKSSRLSGLAVENGAQVDAKTVVQMAREGDKYAMKLVERVGVALGHGLANVLNIFSPDCVVLGGGVMLSWDAFAPHALGVIEKRCQVIPIRQVRIVQARLGLNAGVTGAARALWMHLAGVL